MQGCLKLKRAVRMPQVKTILNSQTAHVELPRNWEDLKAYCGKEETRLLGPFEYGTDVHQGQRSDIELPCALILGGTSTRELALQHSVAFVKYHRGFAALRAAVNPPAAINDRRCFLILGSSGVGKSRWIYRHFPDAYRMACIVHPWIDGYESQPVAVLEECGRGMMGFNVLKELCDIYPLTLPFKGGFAAWLPKLIFLTSNTEPAGWWCPFPDEDYAAIMRRIRVFRFPEQEQELTQLLFPTPAEQADLALPIDSPMDPLPIPRELFELEFLGDQ